MKLLNFVKHKTAGWIGVVYLNKTGEKRVCNGAFDWPLPAERESKGDIVQALNVDLTKFFHLLDRSCENPLSGMGQIRNMVCAELGYGKLCELKKQWKEELDK